MRSEQRASSTAELVSCALAVASTAWTGCSTGSSRLDKSGLPLGAVSRKFVESRFEGHLVYPGATLFRSVGRDEERNSIEGGMNAAFTGGIYTTDDPASRIYSWYRNELVPRGWKDLDVGLGGADSSAAGYQRGARERILVEMDKPELLHDIIGGMIPTGHTIFEERYYVGPAPGNK